MMRQTYQAETEDVKWFDLEKAKEFKEDSDWDGNNNISVATGSQLNHECLYLTRKGSWVKNWWSQWQGSIGRWEEISVEDAAQWLLKNGHPLPDGVDAEDFEG